MNTRFSLDDLLLLVLGAFAAVCGAALGDAAQPLDPATPPPVLAFTIPAHTAGPITGEAA